MLTCKQLDDFLVDFLDGTLPFRQRLTMQMHLGLCAECRQYVAEYRRAIELGRKACHSEQQFEQVPEELIQAVLASVQASSGDGTG
jgi:anti-sigma factor RsiW